MIKNNVAALTITKTGSLLTVSRPGLRSVHREVFKHHPGALYAAFS